MTKRQDSTCAIDESIAQLARRLSEREQVLATAESCTGGLIAAACTEIAGSSSWFERGFVTYSNAAKRDCLGVDPALIEAHGAVSEPVVAAMLQGALDHSPADWTIAVSGVAGPSGGTAEKPVGTVYIGWQARHGETQVERFTIAGDRAAVRRKSVSAALTGLIERLAVS